jgi:hypothetical protein
VAITSASRPDQPAVAARLSAFLDEERVRVGVVADLDTPAATVDCSDDVPPSVVFLSLRLRPTVAGDPASHPASIATGDHSEREPLEWRAVEVGPRLGESLARQIGQSLTRDAIDDPHVLVDGKSAYGEALVVSDTDVRSRDFSVLGEPNLVAVVVVLHLLADVPR